MSEKLDSERLAGMQERLANRYAQLRGEISDSLKQRGENRLASEVHDTKDRAFTELLEGIRQADLLRDLEEARDIEAAQLRMAAGNYGICIQCMEPIPFSRLSAFPTAKRCLRCQQEYERHR